MIRAPLVSVTGPVGLVLILKVSLVLLLALVVATLLRRRSAAARHIVWLTALVGVLALAVLTPLAPRLPVDIPTRSTFPVQPLVVTHSTGSDRRRLASETVGADALRFSSSGAAGAIERRGPSAPTWTLAQSLGALWLAGFVAVLLWSAFGHLGLRALGRAALPIERGTWTTRFGASPPSRGVERARASGSPRRSACPDVGLDAAHHPASQRGRGVADRATPLRTAARAGARVAL